MKQLLSKIPTIIEGKLIEREENCRICDEKQGKQIAVVDYWDIKTARLIKCPKCNHIQLDPMLNDTETSKGCYAYYIEEALRTSKEDQSKNYVRNFRRGVVFGLSLRSKKISPQSVLEMGPGSGYFAAGVQFVFPDMEISVMDINKEVMEFNAQHHQYNTIHEVPDNFVAEFVEKFDLIIARDIIEHVSDISKVVKNVNQYLTSNGFFHFITPNGHEDVWQHYLTSILTNSASELLINHVNYFDGEGLNTFLIQEGFIPLDYYTYKIKTTMRGRGWKKDKKLMSPVSVRRSADFFINEKAASISNIELVKNNILDKWYIQKRAKWITYIYSMYHHFSIIRINPELNVGHEIYGLYEKTKSNKVTQQ